MTDLTDDDAEAVSDDETFPVKPFKRKRKRNTEYTSYTRITNAISSTTNLPSATILTTVMTVNYRK